MPPDDLLAAGWREAVDAFLFDWADDHDVPSVAAALVDRTGDATPSPTAPATWLTTGRPPPTRCTPSGR